MDIDQHVNQIVQGIVTQITTQVQQQAMVAIEQKIAEVVSAIDCTPILAEKLSQKIDAKLNQLPIDANSISAELKSRITALAGNLAADVQTQSLNIIKNDVSKMLNNIEFADMYKSTVLSAIQNKEIQFPDNSIPFTAIQQNTISVSGDQVEAGIIKKFGSTGIDDQATACQLTILDDITVVENNLLTKDLTVKGTATIEGDLNVTGTMPETSPLFISVVAAATNNVRTSLDQVIFKSYADMVVNTIKQDGLDLNKITISGQEIVNGSGLGNFITSSNLQKVGVLQELQVQGESLLSQTLYTTSKRVGVNTIEPAQALSVWDQEVEIGFGKQTTNTAVIGTPRTQTLIVSSNNKNNLTLLPDGSTTVNKINMGTMTFSVADMPPATNEPKGSVVFNSNPSLGGPLGWVSLGDARWANFGIID